MGRKVKTVVSLSQSPVVGRRVNLKSRLACVSVAGKSFQEVLYFVWNCDI